MIIPGRWIFLLILCGIVWGTFKYLGYRSETVVEEKMMPAVAKALAARDASGDSKAFCVSSPAFPYADKVRKTHWVKIAGGLSECKVDLVDTTRRRSCWNCDQLEQAGLISEREVEYSSAEQGDPNAYPVRSRLFELTETGKQAYVKSLDDRSKPEEEHDCIPGEKGYHPESAEDFRDNAPSTSGFCFASGVKFKGIVRHGKPLTLNGKTMIEVTYQRELVDPSPLLSDSRITGMLQSAIRLGAGSLLRPEKITAVFGSNGSDLLELSQSSIVIGN